MSIFKSTTRLILVATVVDMLAVAMLGVLMEAITVEAMEEITTMKAMKEAIMVEVMEQTKEQAITM